MTEGHLFPVTLGLRPDLRVLSLRISGALVTGILFGLQSARRSSQQKAHTLSGGAGRLSKSLIITQVALSLVLLLDAGLLVCGFERRCCCVDRLGAHDVTGAF